MPDEVQTPPPAAGATDQKLSRGEVLRILMMAGFIVAGLLLLRATPWGRQMTFGNVQRMREWLAQWGSWAWLVFLTLGTLLLAVGFPRMLLSVIAGAMFGVLPGTLLAELVTTISAIPAFYYTFFLGREMVTRRMGGRLQKFNRLLERHGFMVLLLIRLCPVGNAFITNCLAGLSAIRFRAYLLASAVGFLPMTFLCALMGGSFSVHSPLLLWSSLSLFIVFILFFIWYFQHSPLARDVMDIMRDRDRQRDH